MEKAQQSLLVFAVLGIVSGVFWMVYILFPNNPLIDRSLIALNGAWVVGDFVVLATALGIHLHHRRNS